MGVVIRSNALLRDAGIIGIVMMTIGLGSSSLWAQTEEDVPTTTATPVPASPSAPADAAQAEAVREPSTEAAQQPSEASAEDDDGPAAPAMPEDMPGTTDAGAAETAPSDTETSNAEYDPPTTTQGTPTAPVTATDASEQTPVVSFGDRADEPGTARTLSFNFQYAPWVDVLKLFAKANGLTLHLRDIPPGTFNYLDDSEYTPTEALDILNGYLIQEGYILVKRNKFLVSINYDNGVPPNLIPHVSLEELENRGRNELLRVDIPLNGVDAEEAATQVEALLGPQGKVAPVSAVNMITVEDIGANLRRINNLFKGVQGAEQVVYKSFQLEYILASEAERQVRSLFSLEQAVRNVSAQATRNQASRNRGGDPRSRDPRFQQQQQANNDQEINVSVTNDPRTNVLHVTATPSEIKVIEELIKTIDVPENDRIRQIVNDNVPVLRVYKVEQADATEVTKTLDSILPGVVVNEDGRNDLIHIMATPIQHREVEELIRRLDGGMSKTVDIIRLGRYDAAAMASMLNSLFLSEGQDAPTIQAETLTGTLIVRGTPEQITQVRQTLMGFGEDGNVEDMQPVRRSGNVRTIPLGGRDPVKFARMLEAILKGSAGMENEFRIIIPNEAEGGDGESPATRRSQPLEDDAPASAVPPRGAFDSRRRQNRQSSRSAVGHDRFTQFVAYYQDGPAETDAAAAPDDTAAHGAAEDSSDAETERGVPRQPAPATTAPGRANAAPPVTIRITNGELVIYSADEDALDRVEDVIAQLQEQVAPETTWTVFYLRSADAAEAAAMLEQLMPDSSVSTVTGTDSSLTGSITSGLSTFGSSLAEMTGLSGLGTGSQTLRIIPDLRSNSLFVSGPAQDVANVEKFLNILDSNDIPDTFRDRQPHTIDVLYADVNDVADIIREVYQDYMEDPNQRRQQQRGGGGDNNNPFAAMFGGGGGGGASPGIRLTLAVDEQTSQIVVSCDEPTYQDILQLVNDRDMAAYQARRTVKTVTLDAANSVVIQQALSTLIPKVNVIQEGQDGRRPPGSASRGGDDRSQADQERAERIRQFFQMQRGGGGPGGGPRAFPGRTGGRPTGGFGGRGGFGGGRGR